MVCPNHPRNTHHWTRPTRRDLTIEAVLHFLDRAWADHLNLLAESREGIHLRTLGRQNSLNEFNRTAISDCKNPTGCTLSAVRETLEQAPDNAPALIDLDLRRPSST